MNRFQIKELRDKIEGLGLFVEKITDDYILVSYLDDNIYPGELFKVYPDAICPECGSPLMEFAESINMVKSICMKPDCGVVNIRIEDIDPLEEYYREVEMEEIFALTEEEWEEIDREVAKKLGLQED